MKRHHMLWLIFCMFVTVLSGCFNNNNLNGQVEGETNVGHGGGGSNVHDEIITLRFLDTIGMGEDIFKKQIATPLQNVYEQIQLEYVAEGNTRYDLSSEEYDLQLSHSNILELFYRAGYTHNLTDLIDAHNVNLSRFDPSFIDNIRAVDPEGSLHAIPFSRHLQALVYNKDIFDQFSIGYPKDQMTWEEVAVLGQQLTLIRNDIYYQGIEPGFIEMIMSQMSIPLISPVTGDPLLAHEQWREFFQFFRHVYSTAGPEDLAHIFDANSFFFEPRTIAMTTLPIDLITIEFLYEEEQRNGLNWDIVSFPTFSNNLGIGPDATGEVLSMSPTTEYQDEVMKIINYMISTDFQLLLSKSGLFATALDDPDVYLTYADQSSYFDGKNASSLFLNTPASTPEYNPYVRQIVATEAFYTHLTGILNPENDFDNTLIDMERWMEREIEQIQAQLDGSE